MKWTEAYEHSGWTIVVPVKLIHAIGAKGAILVAQLFYWSGKQQSEEGWIYKTQLDLEKETGLFATRTKQMPWGAEEKERAGNPV